METALKEKIYKLLDIYDVLAEKHRLLDKVFNQETEFMYDPISMLEEYIVNEIDPNVMADAYSHDDCTQEFVDYFFRKIDRETMLINLLKTIKEVNEGE